jgi:hypothetical protein
MARITPPTQNTDIDLQDHEAYRARLKAIDFEESDHPQYGHQRRLIVDWEPLTMEGFTIRDWISLRLGRQQNGQTSKLRMLLNALSQKPKAEEIAWFDDETLEWSYDGEHMANKLTVDQEVILRGETTEKVVDGQTKRRFKIGVYSPAIDGTPTRGKRVDGLVQGSAQLKRASTHVEEPDPDDEEPPF